ncbi:MAG: DUF2490 domain-containing protein [Crocinitomicaceae bacterium TMED135]|nr:MAG: DUF2490 domain-containing protein [Crocinitomicaceae bacterium TMED135]
MKKTTFILIFSLLFTNTNFSQSNSILPDDYLGNWLMYFGTHHLNDKYSIHYETQLRNYELTNNFFQLLPRVGLNYKIDDNSMVTAGYAFIPTQTDFDEGWGNNMVTENRIWEQFILRNSIGSIKIRHRYRLEQRWVKNGNNTSYKNRARYMLSFKIPLSKKEDFPLFLSVYDEIFINISDEPFNQNRLYTALGYQFNTNANVQLGYLKHHNTAAGIIQNLNRLQLAVFLNTGN